MRKLKVLLSLILIILFIAGCSSDGVGNRADDEQDAVSVDIDLTVLSSIMVSAEVTNIYNNGQANLGKTIRVRGDYENFYVEQLDQTFHYILTINEDDCCQEGFEFRLTGDRIYPDDYPSFGSVIEVVGVLSSHEDFGDLLFYLAVDDILIIQEN